MAAARRSRLPNWLTRRNRVGSIVLAGALLAGVLAASFGVGYRATAPKLDNGINNVPHGSSVVQVNAETRRLEAEARALAKPGEPISVVTLSDGRVATVNNATHEVRLFDAQLTGDGSVVHPSDSAPRDDQHNVVVVAGPDVGYLVDPWHDTVGIVTADGPRPAPVRIPGGASPRAVPDADAGIWVLTDDGRAAHVVRDRVVRVVSTPQPIAHLTEADGRPVAIIASGMAFDVASDPVRATGIQNLPVSASVVTSTAHGAGRYIVALDRQDGRLVVGDPRTGRVTTFTDLPTGTDHDLGEPVVLDDRIYVPDYKSHKLYVRDVASGHPLADVVVPGTSPRFTVEVRDHRVWAVDQRDRRGLVITRDGRADRIDLGPGADIADTTDRKDKPDDPEQHPPTTQPPVKTPAEPPSRRPPTPATTAQPASPVTVPAIPPGTAQDVACQRIRAASLRCDPVPAGAGGPSGTVRGTDPAAGSRVAANTAVRVFVYGGQLSVPDVVGQHAKPACDRIQSNPGTGGQLVCTPQPMPAAAAQWSDLDVVAEQDPAPGKLVDLGATVTVRFWDRIRMPDDLTGRDGAQECGRITAETSNAVHCAVLPGNAAPTPAQNGTVYAQSVVAGAEVHKGDTISLTVYGNNVPKVPAVPPGTDIFTACKAVQDNGYTCSPVDDGVSPTAGVTGQSPPGGTPQSGGNVVVHYAPFTATVLWLWENNADHAVHAIRFEGTSPGADYTRQYQLGRAYPTGQAQPNTVVVNGFFCGIDKTACWGHNPNHYYSLDNDTTPPETWPTGWPRWNGPNPAAKFFPMVNGACPDPRQVSIFRFLVRNGQDHKYSIGHATPVGADYAEPLGCIWTP